MKGDEVGAVPTQFRGVGLCALLLVAGTACGGGPARSSSAPNAAVELASVEIPAPASLRVTLKGTGASIVWSPPAHLAEPLTGYDFYLDEAASLPLGPQVAARTIAALVPGSQHLIQVVAKTGHGASAAAAASFTVPFPARKSDPTETAPAPGSAQAPAAAPQPAAGHTNAGPTQPATHTLKGHLTLLERRNYNVGACKGLEGFADVFGGQKVVVRDGSSRILATGVLGPGRTVDERDDSAALGDQPGTFVTYHCRFTITVPTVPEADFYTVTIATRDGGPIYSLADLRSGAWRVEASLGDDG